MKKRKERKKRVYWQEMLSYLYNNQQDWKFLTEKIKYIEKNPVEVKLNLTHRDFQETFDFLIDNNLIAKNKDKKYYIITEKGFNVALELEKEKREIEKDNREYLFKIIYLLLTFGIFLGSITQAFFYIFSGELTIFGIVSIILISIFIYLPLILFMKLV